MNGRYGGQPYAAQYREQHVTNPYMHEEPEEMVELSSPLPYRSPRGFDQHENGFDFQFQEQHPSPRPAVIPYRPGLGHNPPDYTSSPGLFPTPRTSYGPDSFANTPYGSRSATPTLVRPALIWFDLNMQGYFI